MSADDRVVVVIGLGGMGLAMARRLGPASRILVADANRSTLNAAVTTLRAEGQEVVDQTTDISDEESVAALVSLAKDLGRIEVLVHTAGLSPVQASIDAILRVDLLGTAL